MAEIETDYLVIGAGASAMALVDALVDHADVEVVMVDRRHAAGGHWLDAYPFVRLHQPSAYYGVNSLPLGEDRIDETGINAGFYERATASELCTYYERVLDRLVGTGKVRFIGNTEYCGEEGDGHVVRSRLTGRSTRIRARRRLIDATYVESIVPAMRKPPYEVAEGVRLLAPNELVHLQESASHFMLIGGGKTSMDTGFWLLEQGVDPERIHWIRPRDGWFLDRTYTQPLGLIASMIEYQSRTIEACATAKGGLEFALQLEEHGIMCRMDDAIEPAINRGATVARAELDALRTIEGVVRKGRVRSIGRDRITLTQGDIDVEPGTVHVDCTAQGLATSELRPIFDGDRLTVQFTTLGIAPLSAATIGFVESLDVDDTERNRLCPAVPRTGLIADQLWVFSVGLPAESIRRAVPEIGAWSQSARLNPGRSIPEHLGDPGVQTSMARMGEHVEAAMKNLAAHSR